MSRSNYTSTGGEGLLKFGVPTEYQAQAKHDAGVMQGIGMAARTNATGATI